MQYFYIIWITQNDSNSICFSSHFISSDNYRKTSCTDPVSVSLRVNSLFWENTWASACPPTLLLIDWPHYKHPPRPTSSNDPKAIWWQSAFSSNDRATSHKVKLITFGSETIKLTFWIYGQETPGILIWLRIYGQSRSPASHRELQKWRKRIRRISNVNTDSLHKCIFQKSDRKSVV